MDLPVDVPVDVVVIGAGIVGVSAALTLAEHGIDVVVVDRSGIAAEASGLNAGIIGGGGWGDAPDVDVALKMGSRDRFVDLADQRGHDIGLDLTGTLTMVRTAEEWRWASSVVEAESQHGRTLELLSTSELLEREPAADPGLLGAVLDPLGARAEPVAATNAFAEEARAAGAKFELGREVQALRRVGNGWEVDTAASTQGDRDGRQSTAGATESYRAAAVVIAAGAWVADVAALAGVTVPIVAVRGQMWASKPCPPMLRHAIVAAESMAHWSSGATEGTPPELTHRSGRRLTRHLYGRQRPNGEIVFGGDRVESKEFAIDPDGIAVNHAHVAELLPDVTDLAPVRTWAGAMPFSLDGRPIIGPVVELDGLFIAGGLASSGFGRGPMTGQLVAEQIIGRDPGFDTSSVLPSGRVGRLR